MSFHSVNAQFINSDGPLCYSIPFVYIDIIAIRGVADTYDKIRYCSGNYIENYQILFTLTDTILSQTTLMASLLIRLRVKQTYRD